MGKLNFIDTIRNWKRKIRWNRQYKVGKWDYLFGDNEAPRYLKIIRLMEKYSQNPSVLDLGTGEGVLCEKMTNLKSPYTYFCGIDFSDVSIRKAKKFDFINSEFKVADIHYFIPEKKYDVIIFNEVFYYINNKLKQEVLEKVLSSLNKDGILIVSIFKDGIGCWEFFENNELKKLEFMTVKSPAKGCYWKLGVYKKII